MIDTHLHDHDVDLVHDEARWPAGTPIAFREAYLLPLRALLPSQGLAEASTLVLVAPESPRAADGRVVAPRQVASRQAAPRRRVVLTSDAALYQRLLAQPKPGVLALSPKEACVVAMAGEAGILAPDADSQWTAARARSLAANGGSAPSSHAAPSQPTDGWRVDFRTTGLDRVFRSRTDAEAALTDPLRGVAFPELWWEGDPDLCPGHWLLRGWTVARLAAAWGLSLDRVAVAGEVLAQGEVPVPLSSTAGRAA